MAQLKELGELHASGVLTDEEFAAQKAKLLG
ncbi:MAG TPA: SHOCT domain-containing protein [Solirubrobacterales bacterium]|nr:SHOCT domain-containing protein [Solirubrobacterales bacterium]